LPDFARFSLDELQNLQDVGPKVAGSVYEFFHNRDNIDLLHRLEKAGVNLKNDKKQHIVSGNLNGQTFLFTGTLPTLKRTDAEEMVEKNGGKLLGSVSSKLNFLVVGEDAGSKLEKAKKIPAIRIISEKQFLELLEK